MTLQQFNAVLIENPTFKTFNSEYLSLKLTKLFGQIITKDEIVELRNNLKVWEKEMQSKLDEEIPSEEELAATEYRVESTVKVPIAPKGFTVSSFNDNKVWFKKDENVVLPVEDILKAIQNIKPKTYLPFRQQILNEQNCCLELFITDFHINRMELDGRSIENRCQEYLRIVEKAVLRTKKIYDLEEVVYILGSDFFNSDNYQGTTTKGTPQDNNCTPEQAFTYGIDLVSQTIDYLLINSTKVKVIMLPGNHDSLTSFYFGKTIEALYKNNIGKNIEFDVTSDVRKVHTYGNISWMYHHGNQKPEFIRDEFINFFPQESINKYVEIHVGDLHHLMSKELGRFTFRQFPTLTKADRWTNEKGYYNTPKALVQLFEKNEGRVGEWEIK